MGKVIEESSDWQKAIDELISENLKVASYDFSIFDALGKNIRGLSWLDYGSGPAVLASACLKLGTNIYTFDVNQDINTVCEERLGKDRVFRSLEQMNGRVFDIITCNLVLCIVSDDEVAAISNEIWKHLRKDGKALVGFCNPQIFNVAETQLDIRFPTGDSYWTHHCVPKIKKEGEYKIFDNVRPLSWYCDVFSRAGLEQTGILTTDAYKMPDNPRSIRDFVVFELTRVS